MKVLVIDDEDGLRVTLAANLELEGFEVTDAASVAEAVELLKKQRFDLALSDVRMPGRDGVSGLEDLRRIQPDLPVVFITGYDAEGLLPKAISKGAYTVLSKPVMIDRLVGVLREGARAPAVLVVDDETAFLETIVEELRQAGLNVVTARDSASALEAVKASTVDVCILDLVLPHEDGAVLYGRLREVEPNVRVIAMTSFDVGDLIRDVMNGGAYRCLRKPFEVQMLVRLIGGVRSEPPPPPERNQAERSQAEGGR